MNTTGPKNAPPNYTFIINLVFVTIALLQVSYQLQTSAD